MKYQITLVTPVYSTMVVEADSVEDVEEKFRLGYINAAEAEDDQKGRPELYDVEEYEGEDC